MSEAFVRTNFERYSNQVSFTDADPTATYAWHAFHKGKFSSVPRGIEAIAPLREEGDLSRSHL